MSAEFGPAPSPLSLAEVQAFARIETGEEEALLAGMIRSATEVCERFTGRLLIARPFAETLAASARQPAIPAAAGGSVVDTEARAAIAAIVAALTGHGLVES